MQARRLKAAEAPASACHIEVTDMLIVLDLKWRGWFRGQLPSQLSVQEGDGTWDEWRTSKTIRKCGRFLKARDVDILVSHFGCSFVSRDAWSDLRKYKRGRLGLFGSFTSVFLIGEALCLRYGKARGENEKLPCMAGGGVDLLMGAGERSQSR